MKLFVEIFLESKYKVQLLLKVFCSYEFVSFNCKSKSLGFFEELGLYSVFKSEIWRLCSKDSDMN